MGQNVRAASALGPTPHRFDNHCGGMLRRLPPKVASLEKRPNATGVMPIIHFKKEEGSKPRENKGMSKETKPTLDYRRARSTKLRPSKAASLPVLSIPGGNQTDSELADNRGGDTNAEVSPQGALPVISVPGGTETDPQLAGKSGANTAVEAYSQGAPPILGVPGGS